MCVPTREKRQNVHGYVRYTGDLSWFVSFRDARFSKIKRKLHNCSRRAGNQRSNILADQRTHASEESARHSAS